MSNYGNEHTQQAPSGSRLAYWKNGRSQQQQPNYYPEQNRGNIGFNQPQENFESYGHGTSFMGAARDNVDPMSKIDMVEANIPLVGLAVSLDDTLKNQWTNKGNGTFFTNAELKNELMHRQLALQCYQGSSVHEPVEVENYRNFRQLSRNPVKHYHASMEYTYKAINAKNSQVYSIHRVTNFQRPPATMNILQNWVGLVHPNIVRFHETIQTCAFNDNSLLFVYDFHPLSETLMKHFFHTNGNLKSKYLAPNATGIHENLAWKFIIQISCALRTLHMRNMASRCIDYNRILVNASHRFTISASGIPDVIGAAHGAVNPQVAQVEDVRMFGLILCSLLNGSIQGNQIMNVDGRYSADLRDVVRTLCNAVWTPNGLTALHEIMPKIGGRFYQQIESLQIRNDTLENDLVKELQNGRLFRLLCMLCTVSDRNLPNEPCWSEEPERYDLSLLRGHIFHQVDYDGRPYLDLAHIVLTLNKLDSGVEEAVQLATGSDRSVISSYKELRGYLESSFKYLKQEMERPVSSEMPGGMMMDPQGVMISIDPNMAERYMDPNYALPFVPNVPPHQPPGHPGR